MQNLNCKQLLEILNKAIELNLSQEFVYLLFNELKARFNTTSLENDFDNKVS